MRRSPRSTRLTTPLTGDVNFTSGCNLSTNNASPTRTWSPSLTTTFGFMPVKSSGTSAYSPGHFTSAITSAGLPFRLTSRPLRNLITFVILLLLNTVISKSGVKVQKNPEVAKYLYMKRDTVHVLKLTARGPVPEVRSDAPGRSLPASPSDNPQCLESEE